MRKISLVFMIFMMFFLVSCVDDDDLAAGYPCSVDGEEVCSDSGNEILVCWNELWQTKKSCNTNFGEYCRETASGKLGCKENDSSHDTGDTNTDIGDTNTDTGDTNTDTGDTNTDTGDTNTDTGDTNTDTGDTNTDTGDTNTDTGDTNTDTGDTNTDTGDTNADTGDTNTDTGDTNTDTDADTAAPDPCDPDPCGEYSTGCTAIDETNYKCSCVDGYEWKNNSCEPTAETKCAQAEGTWNAGTGKCTKTVNCDPIPATVEHAEWNGDDSYTLEYNFSEDTWSNVIFVTSYNEEGGVCQFKCSENYYMKNGVCTNGCVSNSCAGDHVTPDSCTPTGAETFTCGCEDGYFWHGNSCINLCDPNPCIEIENTDTDHTCTTINETTYKCGCKDHYFWNGGSCTINTLGRICTAQNKCFNKNSELEVCPASGADFFGQDAQYAAQGVCLQHSFTVAGEGEELYVIDNNTGLEWTQTAWTVDKFNNAKTACDITYAGNSDWRLPNPNELLTIVDSSRTEPPLDPEYFPNVTTPVYSIQKGTSTSFYHLTSTGFMAASSSNALNTVMNYQVICVRGNTLPTGSFSTTTVGGKDVVTDSTTGLMWQKTYSSVMNWQNALKYCETGDGSNYAGYTDWRMPNRNELATLLDFTKTASPYTDFPGITNSQTLWTSTTTANNYANAVVVKFGTDPSVTFYGGKTSSTVPRVLCVRNAD